MADEPPTPATTATKARTTGRGSATKTPRWVYVFGIVFVVVLVVLFLLQHLVFGGLGGHAR